ncbi:MAG TPA: hypothetical protein VF060_26410 [Trebonia sp.]
MTNFAGGWGYPQGQAPYGVPAAPPVPARPRTMTYAVWLMYAGAAVSVVNGVVESLMAHSLITTMFTQFESQLPPGQPKPQIPTDLLTRVFTVAVIIGGVIYALLWLWMAWKNNSGRSWARVTSTVFFGLFSVSVLSSVARISSGMLGILIASLVTFAIGLAVIILIWQPDASRYYEAVKAKDALGRGQAWPPPGGGYGGYGTGYGGYGYGTGYGYGSPESTYGYPPPAAPPDQPEPPPPTP